jgi:hypothetical protein
MPMEPLLARGYVWDKKIPIRYSWRSEGQEPSGKTTKASNSYIFDGKVSKKSKPCLRKAF